MKIITRSSVFENVKVIYREPSENKIYIVIADNCEEHVYDCNILSRKGFIMVPFNIVEGEKYLSYRDSKLITIEKDELVSIDTQEIFGPVPYVTGYEEYISQGNRVLNLIKYKENPISKMVLSRIDTSQNFDLAQITRLFKALIRNYPGAFIYIAEVEGSGLWCGASPEKLIEFNGEILQTVALAGTRKMTDLGTFNEWTFK